MNPSLPAVVVAALGALVVSSCSSPSPAGTEPEPALPTPASPALVSAGDCDALRQLLIESTTEAVVHARYGGVGIDDKYGSKSDDVVDAEAEDFSFQVDTLRVEEEDIVKVVDDDVFILTDSALSIVRTDETGTLTHVANLSFGPDLDAEGLFVRGDSAFLFMSMGDERDDAAFAGTRVFTVDVSDRAAPVIAAQVDIEGDFRLARLLGDDFYVLTSSFLRAKPEVWDIAYGGDPNLPDPEPRAAEERQVELRDAARDSVRAQVAAEYTDVEELLPRIRHGEADPTLLVECSAVFGTRPAASVRLTNIVRFDAADTIATTSIIGDGEAADLAGRQLYLAFSDRWGAFAGRSRLHLFTLQDTIAYTASGDVDGILVDEFSLGASQDSGHIVTTTGDRATVHEFQRDGATLVASSPLAQIEGAGVVVANRFTDENAFVATFGESESVYAVRLDGADVSGPFEVGGLATMIHSLDESHVLVVAQQNDADGQQTGVRLELFDPKRPGPPDAAESIPTGEFAAWSEAMWDARSLAYDAGSGLVAFPVNISQWEDRDGQNFSGVLVYRTADSGLELAGVIDHGDLRAESWCRDNSQPAGCTAPNGTAWWTHVRRSLFVGDQLLTISEAGVKAHATADITQTSSVLLAP